MDKNTLSEEQAKWLFETLKIRFEKNKNRHEKIEWIHVKEKLNDKKEKLKILYEMEKTGGEPDVINYDQKTKEYLFCDCSAQTPIGRRSLCYDQEAFIARKEHKPNNSAVNMAKTMGIEILTEEEYRALQELEPFDTKTSSWIMTPIKIREIGGALFCDRRYERVFVYHNSAESYYSSRGFRGLLRI